MTWTRAFPLAVGALELGAAIAYAWTGQWWLALTWLAYAIACVGLAMAGA